MGAQTFLKHTRAILDNLKEAEQVAHGEESLRGVLRVATPASFGARTVVPILAPFLALYKQLRIELLPSGEA